MFFLHLFDLCLPLVSAVSTFAAAADALGVHLMVIFDALSQHFVYCFLYLISQCKSEK